MKAMNLLIGIALTASLLLLPAGCAKNDVFVNDPTEKDEDLTDLNIPSDFTWSTTSKVAVNVTTNDNTGYTIEIYAQEAPEEALPLTAGVARLGTPFKGFVTIPASDSIVYVVQKLRYNDGGVAVLQSTARIVNGNVMADFANSLAANTKAIATRGATSRAIDPSEWINLPELTANISSVNRNYKISAGTDLSLRTLNMGKGTKIYIAGTLSLPDDFEARQEGSLIVLGEGDLGKDIAGKLMGDDVDIKNGFDIVNYGVVDLKGTLTVGNGATVVTHGCLFADELELNGNGNQGNANDPSYTSYTIGANGCTVVNEMSMQKTRVKMGLEALLHVKEELELKNECIIEGVKERMESGYAAVVIANKVTKQNDKNKQAATIKEGVFVVCDAQSAPPRAIIIETETGAAWGNTNMAKEKEIEIPGSHCSEGYFPNGNQSGVDPSEEEVITSPGMYTYAFEDLWPSFGDYDMNDLVLQVHPKLYVKGGYIEKVEIGYSITAIGAAGNIAAGLQWEGVRPTDIARIEYSTANNFSNNIFDRNSNGTEKAQAKAVVPLFDDAHQFSATNGISGTRPNSKFTPKEFTVTIYPVAKQLLLSNTAIDQWNYFITTATTGGKRSEIHLIDALPTSLFDTSLIRNDVASPTAPFRAKGNFCWAICIPGVFHFPYENNNIRQSYEEFDKWINQPQYDWYNHPVNGKVKM